MNYQGNNLKNISVNLNPSCDWTEITHQYEILSQLGVGSYGNVVEAIDRISHTRVAIKLVNNIFNEPIDSKRILREITLLRNMNCQFVVKIINIVAPSFSNFNKIYIIFEYSQADLKKLIKSSTHLNEDQVRLILYQILCGIKYIHSCSVFHRDLKPANILINENLTIKICDFGLARSVQGLGCDVTEIEDNKNNLLKSLSNKQQKTNSNYFKESKPVSIESLEINEKILEGKSKSISTTSSNQKRVKLGEMGKSKKLTCHVVTRWYRAPELILLEKDYTNAIDIWSIGCIFAELLMMMKSNSKTCFERSALFPGKSCFPLSPDRSSMTSKNNNVFPSTDTDQLNLIFDVLGTPSNDDLDFISDNMAFDYLKSFDKRPPKNLFDSYAGSSKESIDLLYNMIKFNPNKRITVNQALDHSFFSEIRKKELEINARHSLKFDFEKDENLDIEKIRNLFIEEINYYQKISYL